MSCRRPVYAILSLILLGDPWPVIADETASQLFESRIRPLLIARCYGCHSEQSGKREGGLWLDRRDRLRAGGERGPALVPGDADASLLIRAVRRKGADLQMPPGEPLRAHEIADLEQWVALGAHDPRDPATGVSDIDDPSDPIAGRSHWAFQPLSDVRPPDLDDERISTPIDAFALSQLQAAGMQPVEEADRRVLARRLFFQLIGLPPSPQQLESFQHDPRADACERLVDELLSSPQFGERWGRHWLDLARYADSNGLDENFLFREAWRYRNWVIGAVNEDLPFDRSLLEQLAGDLLPYDSIAERDRQRIAAGFLVIGPKVLLGVNADKQRMDVADEQLDTIGRAVLGQTLGCARCHDHKFDPIPTDDYYALAGIMTSTQVVQQRYMLNQQRVMERLVGLGGEGDRLNEAYETFWREQPAIKKRREHAKTALKLLEENQTDKLAALTKEHSNVLADLATEKGRSQSDRIEAQRALIAELDEVLSSPPPIPPRAMIPADAGSPADESIRLSGEFGDLGETVPRGFLRVIGDTKIEIPPEQSGRLELARWLTDIDNGAGRLSARVLANRVWHHLIGRGLVRTVDNFGRTGERPSHPELLEYLARELIDSGWSVKHLVRQIVLSKTFRRSSRHCETGHSVDPENRLLWRANRRRLDPESLRDALLFCAGRLDPARMNSTVDYLGDQATSVGDNKNRRRTDFPCRSVYLPVIRNDLPEVFDVFDFADPQIATGRRPETMAATQGLFLLNDALMMEVADETVARLGLSGASDSHDARVDELFVLLFGRTPTNAERDDVLSALGEIEQQLPTDAAVGAEQKAWSIVCQALMASSLFQIVE